MRPRHIRLTNMDGVRVANPFSNYGWERRSLQLDVSWTLDATLRKARREDAAERTRAERARAQILGKPNSVAYAGVPQKRAREAGGVFAVDHQAGGEGR